MALTYTGGLQGTGDTKSPLYIWIASQIIIPLGICFFIRKTSTLDPIDIWFAILVGHFTRCALSVWRFNQGNGGTSPSISRTRNDSRTSRRGAVPKCVDLLRCRL